MTARVAGLKIAFNGLRVLEGIDLEASPGEFAGITGPSGCGKTTLLHAIAGLIPPQEGAVRAESSLAYVFQRPTLLPWRNALDNAAFGLECRGVPAAEARRRARELMAQVGMGDFAGHWPHQLSEGMKQRLSLARAMLVKPRLVLLDEPFSALDAKARRELQDLLLEFWSREHFTALFVSHWTEELVYLADKVIVLSPRPARVQRIVPIALERPRGLGTEGRRGLIEAAEACR